MAVATATREELVRRLDPIVERHRGKKGITIPLLSDVQKVFGYLPEDAVEYVGKALDIPVAELFGVATFYAMFRLRPQGKYVVRLCRGTACHVQGSGRIGEQLQRALEIQEGNTTADGMFTLQYVACLGCCSLAPVMMVGEDVHGRLTPEKAVEVLEGYRARRVEP